ncbi:MAG: ORF6N domain-containing protein [Bryobacteraceae bacterium]
MPKKTKSEQLALAASAVEAHIHIVRGHRAMVSNQLAALYQVEPKVLVQAVKRNADRS